MNESQPNIFYMENPEEMLKPWVSNPMFFEISIVHGITFIFGLIGNAIVIVALAGDRRIGSATNTFLVSLALGDLLMLCVHGPLETYSHFVIGWDENSVVCKAAKYAELLSAMSSVLNLLAVTIERFIVIMFPMKSRIVCTSANTTRAVLGVWFLATVLALPIIFTTGTYQYQFSNNMTTLVLNYCDNYLKYPNVVIYHFLIVFVLPSGLLTICYTFVIRELWASTQQMNFLTQKESCQKSQKYKCQEGSRRKSGSVRALKKMFAKNDKDLGVLKPRRDEANKARKQVIKMLILVVLMFFFCWGPRLTMELLSKYNLLPFNPAIYRLKMIFNQLTFVHGCVNPFIYCFMSKNFRMRFFKFCGMHVQSEAIRLPSQRQSAKSSKSFKSTLRGSVTKQTDVEDVSVSQVNRVPSV